MEQNFKLLIEYDGTCFSGWQRQKDRTSIQGEIEKQLSRILNSSIRISGSGRTDAGVHAFEQVASFKATTKLSPDQIKKGLNSLIKDPIVIHECSTVDPDFHAQYSAVSKEYNYYILNRQNPCAIGSHYQWHIINQLDLDLMNQCCKLLAGTHDFKAFENTGSPRASTVRKVLSANVYQKSEDRLIFKIIATGFLKYMVRNIMGTLVLAGHKKITPTQFQKIMESRDRPQAGPTAPPHGLFLKKVNYS